MEPPQSLTHKSDVHAFSPTIRNISYDGKTAHGIAHPIKPEPSISVLTDELRQGGAAAEDTVTDHLSLLGLRTISKKTARIFMQRNWRKFLIGSDKHHSFLVRAILKHSGPHVYIKIIEEYGDKILSFANGELCDQVAEVLSEVLSEVNSGKEREALLETLKQKDEDKGDGKDGEEEDKVAALECALLPLSEEAARIFVQRNWRKFLIGSDKHQSFLACAVLKHSGLHVYKRIMEEYGEKILSLTNGEFRDQFVRALSKTSGKKLEALLETLKQSDEEDDEDEEDENEEDSEDEGEKEEEVSVKNESGAKIEETISPEMRASQLVVGQLAASQKAWEVQDITNSQQHPLGVMMGPVVKGIRGGSNLGGDPSKDGIVEMRSTDGTPAPAVGAAPFEGEAKFSDAEGEDNDDEEQGEVMDLDWTTPSTADFAGFKEHVIRLYPKLERENLADRIARQQVVRYGRLLQWRVKHSNFIANQNCPAGNHCIALGGHPKILEPKNQHRDSDANGGAQVVADISEGDSKPDGLLAAECFPPGVPMPPVQTLPAEFECQLCFRVKRFTKPSDWTKHVYEDVQPFTCTYPGCEELESFKRKADCVRHENERHRHLSWWTCTVDDCKQKCYRKDNFLQHLVREHKILEPKQKTKAARKGRKSDGASGEFIQNCHHKTTAKPQDEPCKYCGNVLNSWSKLTAHLAEHMKLISWSVLRLVDQQAVNVDTIFSPVERVVNPGRGNLKRGRQHLNLQGHSLQDGANGMHVHGNLQPPKRQRKSLSAPKSVVTHSQGAAPLLTKQTGNGKWNWIPHLIDMERLYLEGKSILEIQMAIQRDDFKPTFGAVQNIFRQNELPIDMVQRFQDGLCSTLVDTGSKTRTAGRRVASLPPDIRDGAARMRKLGACLRCRLLKKSCDEETPCKRCQTSWNKWDLPCSRINIQKVGDFLVDISCIDMARAGNKSWMLITNDTFTISRIERSVEWQRLHATQARRIDSEASLREHLSTYLEKHLGGDLDQLIYSCFSGAKFITDVFKTLYSYFSKERSPNLLRAMKLLHIYNLMRQISRANQQKPSVVAVGDYTKEPALILDGPVTQFLVRLCQSLHGEILEDLSTIYKTAFLSSDHRLKDWPKVFVHSFFLLAIWETIQFDCFPHSPIHEKISAAVDVIVGLFRVMSNEMRLGHTSQVVEEYFQHFEGEFANSELLRDINSHILSHINYLESNAAAPSEPNDVTFWNNSFVWRLFAISPEEDGRRRARRVHAILDGEAHQTSLAVM